MPNILSHRPRISAHKVTHQDAGSDELSVAGLSGTLADAQPSTWAAVASKPTTFAPSAHNTAHNVGGDDVLTFSKLVFLADTADPQYNSAALTKDASFHDLDLSALIPAGSKAVIINVRLQATTSNALLQLRKKGFAETYCLPTVIAPTLNVMVEQTLICEVDANRVLQYTASSFTFTYLDLKIRAYFL